MAGDVVQPEVVKRIFRDALTLVFGSNGSKILEHHLRKILYSDPYEAFYENPKTLCEGLRSFFGNGVRGLLQVLAKTMIEEYRIKNMSPEELIDLLNKGDEGSKKKLFLILCSSYLARGGET